MIKWIYTFIFYKKIMTELIILRWLPASWKTTYANKLIELSDWKMKRINRDILRQMFDFNIYNKKNEEIIRNSEIEISKYLLDQWYTVIIDDTNLKQERVNELIDKLRWFYSMHDVIDIIENLDICIERDRKRENPIWKEVIIDMYNKYYMNKSFNK